MKPRHRFLPAVEPSEATGEAETPVATLPGSRATTGRALRVSIKGHGEYIFMTR